MIGIFILVFLTSIFALVISTNANSRTKTEESNQSSMGISFEMDSKIPPFPPGKVNANVIKNNIKLTWKGTGLGSAVYYTVYRRLFGADIWGPVANIPIQGDNRGEYVFKDSNVKPGTTYEYSVAIVDRHGNESRSEIVEANLNE